MLTARTVLVVEDDPLTLKALTLAVRVAGCSALAARDGASALELLATSTADLACLDLVLPDMDGVELARRIRERPNGAEIILVALSGRVAKLDEACMLSRGFRDVIEKPIEPSRLAQRLARLLPTGLADARSDIQGGRRLVDSPPR